MGAVSSMSEVRREKSRGRVCSRRGRQDGGDRSSCTTLPASLRVLGLGCPCRLGLKERGPLPLLAPRAGANQDPSTDPRTVSRGRAILMTLTTLGREDEGRVIPTRPHSSHRRARPDRWRTEELPSKPVSFSDTGPPHPSHPTPETGGTDGRPAHQDRPLCPCVGTETRASAPSARQWCHRPSTSGRVSLSPAVQTREWEVVSGTVRCPRRRRVPHSPPKRPVSRPPTPTLYLHPRHFPSCPVVPNDPFLRHRHHGIRRDVWGGVWRVACGPGRNGLPGRTTRPTCDTSAPTGKPVSTGHTHWVRTEGGSGWCTTKNQDLKTSGIKNNIRTLQLFQRHTRVNTYCPMGTIRRAPDS